MSCHLKTFYDDVMQVLSLAALFFLYISALFINTFFIDSVI